MLGNLPDAATPLVGRRQELSDVRDLLSATRVLTLIGTGGVGKTRLALELATDRRRAFPDGVWYVALDGIDDEALLVTHVMQVLGCHHAAHSGDPVTALARSLRDRHLLLILDSCERLLPGVATLVEAVARAAPNVWILATSRAPLRAAGDVTYSVPPLSMPRPSPDTTDRQLDASDAVRLFVDRARAVDPGFEVGDGNRADVYDVVRRLDQIPVAIQLAAAQLRTLSIRDIAARMAGDRSILDWDEPSSAGRQWTMRESLQWSAQLCTDGERRLWSRLSVFRGSFDLESVEAVCSDDGPGPGHVEVLDVVDLVQGLVERSIVVREDHRGVVRFSMLGVMRHFGHTMLDDDSNAAFRLRHMRWFLDMAARASAEWDTDRQTHWLTALPRDRQNLFRALAVAASAQDTARLAAQAVWDLWRYYWWACGWFADGLHWVHRSAALLVQPAARAQLLLLGSLLAWSIGDAQAGRALLEDGRAAAEAAADGRMLAFAEHVLGDAALYRGDLEIAATHFRRALATYATDMTGERVDTLLMLTLTLAVSGDATGAERSHAEALSMLGPGEIFHRSYSLLYLGEAFRRAGDPDRALDTARAALRLKVTTNDPLGIAWALAVLAEAEFDAHRRDRAAFLAGAASRLWRSMAIDGEMLARFQIRADAPRQKRRSAGRSPGIVELTRRGSQADLDLVVGVALGAAVVPARLHEPAISLTARESEIARLVADGSTNKQIAAQLMIAPRTSDAHVQNILTKLGLSSRTQVAAWLAARAEQD